MQFSDFEITKREILFSTIILCVMVGIGILISNTISTREYEKQIELFSAVRIDNSVDKFDYIARTDVGNFLANGTLKAIHPVTIPDIEGSYFEIRKVKEEYTAHTRTYTISDGKGHTNVHVETYWTWDEVERENFKTDSVVFLKKRFSVDSVDFNNSLDYKETINAGGGIRYVYSTYPTSKKGVMCGKATDKKYTKLKFVPDTDINKYLENKEKKMEAINIGFWVIWMVLTGLLVFMFYYAENNWLED